MSFKYKSNTKVVLRQNRPRKKTPLSDNINIHGVYKLIDQYKQKVIELNRQIELLKIENLNNKTTNSKLQFSMVQLQKKNDNMINDMAMKDTQIRDYIKEIRNNINTYTEISKLKNDISNIQIQSNKHIDEVCQLQRQKLLLVQKNKEHETLNTRLKNQNYAINNMLMDACKKNKQLEAKLEECIEQANNTTKLNKEILKENDIIKIINLDYEEEIKKYEEKKIISDIYNKTTPDYNVTCHICCESADLVMLPCSHKMCQKCISELEEQLCPYCRAPI